MLPASQGSRANQGWSRLSLTQTNHIAQIGDYHLSQTLDLQVPGKYILRTPAQRF